MDKVHVYMCLHIASIKPTAENKTKFSPSPFLICSGWFLILAEAFRNDHVVACSAALSSATEKNEMGGYVTVLCSSKMTQRSSTAGWLKFKGRHQIGCDGTHTEKMFNFEVSLCNNSCKNHFKLVDTVNLDLKYCTS